MFKPCDFKTTLTEFLTFNPSTMSQLHRLVYTSFRKPECSESEIDNILQACKRNNPGQDVTGVLIHSQSRFIQYLEGSGELIMGLYEKIKGDSRHTAVNLRNFEPIDERVFPSWHMGYKDVSGKDASFYTNISQNEKDAFSDLIQSEVPFNDRGVTVLKLFFTAN